MQTDFLVIGSGIAGLTYALKIAKQFPAKTIIIITKTQADETNTKYAQGGIAGVWDESKDSYEKHIEDTLIAGDGLCNPQIVEIVVTEGPKRIKEIIEYGAQFDKDDLGDYSLGKEGGHSENRILHHKDVTGQEMERALLSQLNALPNIQLLNHCFVVDLLTQHHLGYLVTKSTVDTTCYGVYVLNLHSNKIETIAAKIILLASGGCGQAYRTTTNPKIATGDGIAMVYRAKGKIENMEFIQYSIISHNTVDTVQITAGHLLSLLDLIVEQVTVRQIGFYPILRAILDGFFAPFDALLYPLRARQSGVKKHKPT